MLLLFATSGLVLHQSWTSWQRREARVTERTKFDIPDSEAFASDGGSSFFGVDEQLDIFEHGRSINALYHAHSTLGLLSSFVREKPCLRPHAHRARRKELIRLWLRMFRLMDAAVDPKFDSRDGAHHNVFPPADYPVNQMSDIEDPVLRSIYERAVAENDRKGAYWILQVKLRQLDSDFEPDFAWFVSNWFSATTEDRNELENALRADISDAARIDRFLHLVPECG